MRIAEKRPGDLINLTIFRFDELSTLLVKLGGRTGETYQIQPVENQLRFKDGFTRRESSASGRDRYL